MQNLTQIPQSQATEGIVDSLETFLNQEILEEEDIGLEATTPLLQLGIIDSLTMVSLLGFIETEYGVQVPNEEVTPENFENLEKIAQLVNSLQTNQSDATSVISLSDNNSHPLDETLRILEAAGVQRRIIPIEQDGFTHYMHSLAVTGEQPTWILLAGLGNPSTSWATILRSQLGQKSAIAIDLSGFGLSKTDQPAPTYNDHLQILLSLLPLLAQPPYVMVGSSAGAMLATEIARRHPEWVKALVVTGFGAIQDIPTWRQQLMELSQQPEQFLQSAYHRPPKLTPMLQTLIDDTLSRPAYQNFLDSKGVEAMTHTFDNIAVPTLFVSGQEDQIIPAEAVKAAFKKVPGSQLEWLSRCGHFPPAEQPEELMYLIENFLTKIEA